LKAGSPDWDGTDDHGFSALPGGAHYTGISFSTLGSLGRWWTATEYDATSAYSLGMLMGYTDVDEGIFNKSFGFSARCLQD
jgi:uncharacterized protein (TIGR02145 family)